MMLSYNRYALITIPRSGSMWLWTGLVNILSYINNFKTYSFIQHKESHKEFKFKSLKISLKFHHFGEDLNSFDRVILLYRKDRIKQAISLYMADNLGLFQICETTSKESFITRCSTVSLLNASEKITFFYKKLCDLYKLYDDYITKCKTPYIMLSYEDLVFNYNNCIKNCLNFLHIKGHHTMNEVLTLSDTSCFSTMYPSHLKSKLDNIYKYLSWRLKESTI